MMSEPILTMNVDVSALEKAIPRIVAFGRRTIQEQCVTSVTFIAYRAQQLTPAATIGRIDSDLDVQVSPVLSKRGKRKGLPLKSGKKTVQGLRGARVPLGVLIVMSRMNPSSKYSQQTGNRWPVTGIPKGAGTAAARQRFIGEVLSRMVMSRHSSTNFLQTGWKPAIRAGMESEFYRYNSAFGKKSLPKSSNALNAEQLGSLLIEAVGDNFKVIATNDVGDNVGKSNDKLAEKHRLALIEYGTQPLQQAVSEEASTIERTVEKRLDEGMKVKFPELL